MCMHARMCLCLCVSVHASVEVKGQLGVVSQKSYPSPLGQGFPLA